MARPLRIEYPGAWYHVMNRGGNHRVIFLDSLDRQIFLEVLSETVRLGKIRIHAYSLMDNHYHLLIETPLGNLSRAMRQIDGVYAQRHNRRHQGDGPLFRGRFKSILVEKESYLLELVRYIHLNPVRALRYPKAIQDPFTSHRAYLKPEGRPPWLSTEEVLFYFGGDSHSSRKELDDFVQEGVSQELMIQLEGKKWPAVLGRKGFLEEIRNRFLKERPRRPEVPQEKDLLRLYSPKDVLEKIREVYQTDLKTLTQPSSGWNSEPKRAAMFLLRYSCQLTYDEIGRMLGGLSDSTIASICTRMNQDSHPKWRSLQRGIEEEIRKSET